MNKLKTLIALLNKGLNEKSVVIILTNEQKYELRLSLEVKRAASKMLEEPIYVEEHENSLNKLTSLEFADVLIGTFPDLAKNGVPVKGNRFSVEKALREFTKKFKYNRKLIVDACTFYVQEQEKQQFLYCKTLVNFIFAYNKSSLADICEAIKNDAELLKKNTTFVPKQSTIVVENSFNQIIIEEDD